MACITGDGSIDFPVGGSFHASQGEDSVFTCEVNARVRGLRQHELISRP